MDLYDQHLHSRHSFDSQADPAANVESAIAHGLAGLTFTEHFDTHPDDWAGCVYDDAAYTATIDGLRERLGDRIFIGKGIEVCFQPDRMDFILDFLSRHEFDLVILSVHYFGDRAVYKAENWRDHGAEQGTRLYLETVLDAVRCCERLRQGGARVFDVLGHLDFVKRYTQRFFGTSDLSSSQGLLDDILSTCIAADLTPEINTSSWRQDLDEPMPGASTIARYAQLGGTAVSLGSDAHRPQDIGAGLDRGVDMLRDAGIGNVAVFKDRRKLLTPC